MELNVSRLNLNIDETIYRRLQAAAASEGRSVSDVVRVLVNSWLKFKEDELCIELKLKNINEKSRGNS